MLVFGVVGAGCECGGDSGPDAGPDANRPPRGDAGPTTPEDCGNGIDDDGDGRADCEDVECSAPPLDPDAASFFDSVRFLIDPAAAACAGGTAVQHGADGIIPSEAAVLTGFVEDEDGYGLGGVDVTVLGRPSFGRTTTADDGRFFMVVNAGPLVLDLRVGSHLPSQRTLAVRRHEITWAGHIVLVRRDARVTEVELGRDERQIARGSRVSDADGERTATLLLPSRTEADLVMPDGRRVPASRLHLRLTEFTTTDRGVERMPGTLPTASGYTYAVEVDTDEGVEAGALSVEFNRPVPLYVENFLGFPVGTPVPLGYYDREDGRWHAARDGLVIRVLATTDGVADVDTDGDGAANPPSDLDAIGIDEDERRALAETYEVGTELWRAPIEHLTPWDCNWPFGPPLGFLLPDFDLPTDGESPQPCEAGGSIVGCQAQTLGEAVPIPGTGQALHYQSDQAPARTAAYQIAVPLGRPGLPGDILGIDIEVDVAGVHVEAHEDVDPARRWTWEWDGRDAFGRDVPGVRTARVLVGYRYAGEYREPEGGARSFGETGGAFITGNRTREEVTVWSERFVPLGVDDRRREGLGGWSLSAHHRFDPSSFVLTRGDGRRVAYAGRVPPVERFAGSVSTQGVSGDGAAARDALLMQTSSLAVADDGRVFIADAIANRVRVVRTDGTIETYAGTGRAGSSGDGGPAAFADLARPSSLAMGPDASLYVASSSEGCIRRIDDAGNISTFAGQCGRVSPGGGNGGPASAATLGMVSAVAVDASGRVCFAESSVGLVRCVEPGSGIVTQLAGGGAEPPESASALDAALLGVSSLAFDDIGRLYAAIPGRHRVYVVAGGWVSTYAGTGAEAAFEQDGGALSQSMIAPFGLATDPSGELCITDLGAGQLICVDSTQVARLRVTGPGTLGDGVPANRVALIRPSSAAFGPDGEVYIGQGGDLGAFVTRVAPSWPRAVDGDWWVPSEDAALLHRFTASGRHAATYSVTTRQPLLTFRYTADGALSEIEDADAHVLRVERTGGPRLIAPFGQRTELGLDGEGWLRSISDPLGREWAMTYHPPDERGRGGLLARFESPGGATSTFTYDDDGRLLRDEGDEEFSLSLTRAVDGLTEEIVQETSEGRVTRYRNETDPAGVPRTVVTHTDGTSVTVTRPVEEAAGDVSFTGSDGTTLTTRSAPHPVFGRAAPWADAVTITLPSGASLTSTGSVAIDYEPATVPPVITRATWVQTSPSGETRSTWDPAARVITTTSPEGRTATFELDDEGRLEWARAPGLHPTQYAYDTEGRLAEIRRGVPGDLRRAAFRYATDGFVDRITDPDDEILELARDGVGRVTSITGRGGDLGFGYDDTARRLTVTQSGGGEHRLGFDLRGRPATYESPSALPLVWAYDADGVSTGASVGAAHAVTFTADPSSGRTTRIAAGGDAIVPTYDAASGFVREIAGPGGVTVGFVRDGPRVEQQTWSGSVSGAVTYAYDASFRVRSVTVAGEPPVALSFDRDGLLLGAGPLTISRDAATGIATGSTLDDAATTQRVDAFGALAELSTSWPGGTFGQVIVSRDALGRILELDETDGATTTRVEYVYDDSDRLQRVLHDGLEVERYEYGANGQRTSWTNAAGAFSATYDAEGRLATAGSAVVEHNDYGQRETVTDGVDRTELSYDDFGNLRTVRLSTGSTIEYEVDGFGRRVQKSVDGVRQRSWLYIDGLRPIAELAPDGSVRAVFIYGTRPHVPDAIRTPTATYRVVTDQLGSVRRVVDASSGAVAQALDYDAFGRVTRDTNPGFTPFGFAGGLYDPDTGLVRFGARDYDPAVGQWTARDPIGLRGGDTNLCAYVANDPVNFIDPTGLYVETAIDVASIGYDLYAIGRDNVFGDCNNLGANLLALGLDVVGLALPFVTGLGAASRGARAVRSVNIYGEGEALPRFLDYATEPAFSNGRPLTRGLPSRSVDRIFLRSAPISATTASEIARIAAPGARIDVVLPSGAAPSQISNLIPALGSRVDSVTTRAYTSQHAAPGVDMIQHTLRLTP